MREKFNCLAEDRVDRFYYNRGYMGTEIVLISFSIIDEDIDFLNQIETLNVYGKEYDFDVDLEEMMVYFNYYEEEL